MTLLKKGGVDDVRRWFSGEGACADELALFDAIAREPARLSGLKVRFYSLRRAMNRDPLYGEPGGRGEWSFHGPYDLWATVEYEPESTNDPEASEQGIRFQADAVMWIARAELEAVDCPDPKEGDVVGFWMDGERPGFEEPKESAYWDVAKATPAGHTLSSATFTMWRLDLRRRSHFDASRRVIK